MEEYDTMVSCPFDSNHKVLRSRITQHIIRCSKNDPRKHLFVNKRQCDFDASHFVDKKDYEKHLTECAAAIKILKSGNVDDDQTASNILPVNDNNSPTSDDWGTGEWDGEVGFNLQEAIQNSAIVQPGIGLSRAERRRHRNQERRRINDLTQDGTGSST